MPEGTRPLDRAALLMLRVGVGTALFALVLTTVQSSESRVAGMMMAFPALNGISLLMAPPTDKTAMARAMLPVIALNGWIAMAFIAVFGLLVDLVGSTATSWVWPLAAVAFAVWLAIIGAMAKLPARAGGLLLAAFLFSVPLLIAAWWRCPATDSFNYGDIATIIDSRIWRIGLFAATLFLLLSIAEMFGDAHGVLGRLGAFPLLPLYSLATVALSGAAPADGLVKLTGARPAILVGILLAMGFALIYSRFLMILHRRGMASSGWWAAAILGLATGWMATGGAILVLAEAMNFADGTLTLTGCN